MLEFVKKLLGGGNDAALKKLKKTVDAVDALEEAGHREIITAGTKELLKLPEFRDADKAH